MSSFAVIGTLLHVVVVCLAASTHKNEKCLRIFPDFSGQWIDYRYQGEWGGLCNTGKRQSPIDINTTEVCSNDETITPLQFKNFDEPQKLIVQNTGFHVRAFLDENEDKDERPSICGAGLDGNYVLNTLVFHWPNEHTINQDRADLGIDLVFYSDEFTCLEDAARKKGAVVIVNIGYNVENDQGPPAFDSIARAVRQVAHCTEATKETSCDGVNLKDFLPECEFEFYRYEGSVPVPGCQEGLIWLVIRETGSVGTQQFETIREIYNQTGILVSFSTRSIQPVCDRVIYQGSGNNNGDECEDCQTDNNNESTTTEQDCEEDNNNQSTTTEQDCEEDNNNQSTTTEQDCENSED